MLNILAVFIGGGIGASLRYLIGVTCLNYLKTTLPAATFTVNIAGCFILGFLYIYFTEKYQIPQNTKVALTAGFCGGLTTFSTFSLEVMEMIKNTQILHACIYIILSVFCGILAVYIGGNFAKFL